MSWRFAWRLWVVSAVLWCLGSSGVSRAWGAPVHGRFQRMGSSQGAPMRRRLGQGSGAWGSGRAQVRGRHRLGSGFTTII
ncbi:unnamed protein product [Microthlaspi erraticum]|uniref:Uncharacterized protein n=1 Tax=Microthlaspi erraticum TaxID=1685480 RepID=A0A6D2JY26_9BRAS|nr:unnamed protein product [Microthlaspi erraticum]